MNTISEVPPKEQQRAVPHRIGVWRSASTTASVAYVIATVCGVALAFFAVEPIQACFVAAWWIFVMVVIRSDLADFLIPDHASLGIALLGLAAIGTRSLWIPEPSPWPSLPWSHGAIAVLAAMVQGATAAAVLWVVGRTFRAIRGFDGLGFGDVKLAGASAIWLDPWQQALALHLATLTAIGVVLLTRNEGLRAGDGALPFGAFLAPAAWITYLAVTMGPQWFEVAP
uniref:General secretion pathway protein O n=1 Tax=Rhodopseudomonas palustris (strain BisA53) TaxID=316055 RepID=Q07N79_RHOP5